MTILRPLPAVITTTSRMVSASNLLTYQPGERAAVTSAGAGYVTFDLGSVQTIQQVLILYHDAVSGESFGIRASIANADPSADTTPSINSSAAAITSVNGDGIPAGYRHSILHLAAPVTARYVRVTFPANRSMGRVAIGACLQPENNADYGDTSWGFEEAPDPDTLDSGVTILEELPAAPYFEFTISWASEAEMELGWQPLARLQWTREPVVVVRRPDTNAYRHTGIFYGILKLQPFVAAQFDLHEVRGKIRSMV